MFCLKECSLEKKKKTRLKSRICLYSLRVDGFVRKRRKCWLPAIFYLFAQIIFQTVFYFRVVKILFPPPTHTHTYTLPPSPPPPQKKSFIIGKKNRRTNRNKMATPLMKIMRQNEKLPVTNDFITVDRYLWA